MERWELKMICAAVALVVSVTCSFLPFLLIHATCVQRVRNKMAERRAERSREVGGANGPVEIRMTGEDSDPGKTDVNGNISQTAQGQIVDLTGREGEEEEEGEEENEGTLDENSARNPCQDENVLGILMCFGGGVFFGTFLLHMLPEVTDLLDTSLITPAGIRYPLAELMIAAGFFMILFVEELVISCQRLKARGVFARKSSKKCDLGGVQSDDSLATSSGISGDLRTDDVSVDPGKSNHHDAQGHGRSNGHHHGHHPHRHSLVHEEDHSSGHHHHHSTRSIVLVLALSLHHIFEGLSIGLQKYFNNVWHLTVAVLCHETAICFSMGLQFYKSDQKLGKKVFVILLLASSVMPLGIVIGIAISESHQDVTSEDQQDWQNILNGVLQALACGTFIYVTFFEILCEELGEGKSTPLKVIFVGLGFTFMALLGLIPDSDDNLGIVTNGNLTTLQTNHYQ